MKAGGIFPDGLLHVAPLARPTPQNRKRLKITGRQAPLIVCIPALVLVGVVTTASAQRTPETVKAVAGVETKVPCETFSGPGRLDEALILDQADQRFV